MLVLLFIVAFLTIFGSFVYAIENSRGTDTKLRCNKAELDKRRSDFIKCGGKLILDDYLCGSEVYLFDNKNGTQDIIPLNKGANYES